MENQVYEVSTRDQNALADDTLIAIARQAEARIDAVVKIKQLALKVTNGGDWTDQGGKPYLMVSGAEKIANLFNVSWSFLTPEPIYEETADGHYTFTYQGRFSMGGRSIEVEGSRSSKDKFFNQNEYVNDVKTAKAVGDRDNKRDVKMAALTNLLGNGITRLLGIRNLAWADLSEYAGITQDQCGKVEYKKNDKAPVKEPQKKSDTATTGSSTAAITIKGVVEQTKTQAGAAMKSPLYHIHAEEGGDYKTFDKKLAELATASIGKPADITFEKNQYGNDLKTIVVIAERTPGEEG
jgi:hypothetical protein